MRRRLPDLQQPCPACRRRAWMAWTPAPGCPECRGAGMVPTPAGRAVLALVATHLGTAGGSLSPGAPAEEGGR